MGVAQAAIFFFQFGSSVVLARLLTPTEMGIFAVGLAVVAILGILQNFGLQPLIIREKHLTPGLEATIFTANAVNLTAQAAVTVLLASLGAAFLREEGVRHILIVLSISPLFGILSFMPGAKLEREGRFKEIALISACTSAVGSVTTVAFAYLGHTYMSLAYGNLVGAFTLAAALMVVGREHNFARIGFSEWRRVYHFGFQMFAVSGVITLSQRLSEIVLGRISGLAGLGLYNRASGVNNMLWGNIHHLASRVMMVDYANHHRSGLSLRGRYIQTVATMTALLWPGFAGLAVVAKPFIFLVYGERWMGAALPLMFLATASLILVALTMTWELFVTTGDVRTQTRLEIIRASVSLPLFIGACFFGIEAAAFSRILDAALAFILYRPHLDRMTGTTLRDLLRVYLQSAGLTVLAILPAAALVLLGGALAFEWPILIIAVLAGGTFWGVALFRMEHPLSEEMRRILKRMAV